MNLQIEKTYTLGCFEKFLKSRLVISDALEGDAIAKIVASLSVSNISENNLKQFQHPRWKSIQIYSSRWWRISANKPETRECSPNFWPSIGLWNADIADLYDPTVLYSKPLSKRSAKKSKMQVIGDLIGEILRLIHQLLHFCSSRHVTLNGTLQWMKIVQIRSYFWSEYRKIRTRNNSVISSVAVFDILSACRSSLRLSKPVVWWSLPELGDVNLPCFPSEVVLKYRPALLL